MGYLVAAELAPNLLFSLHAGAWADQRERKRQIMIATDLGRALLIGSIPVAYAFDALTFPHMFVVAFLMGTLSVALPGCVQPALRRARATRPLDRGRLDHARKPRSLVRRRTEHRWPARAGPHGARDPRRRRLLLRRLGPLPPERRGRRAAARGPGQGPCRRRRALGVRQPDRPRGARCHGDDQLLQLRLLRALHPLREQVARHRTGDARTRARRRRRRQSSRRGRDRSSRRQDRGRAGVRASAASSSRRHCCSSRLPVGRTG